MGELNDAWHNRQLVHSWDLCFKFSLARKGDFRKWGRTPRNGQPSAAQYLAHLGKKGRDGGLNAVEASFSPWEKINAEDFSHLSLTNEHFNEAKIWIGNIRAAVRKSQNRKSVPQWDVPSELWRIVFWPQRLKT